MLGHIESYDQDIQTGIIKAEDKFFEFYIDDWTSKEPPKVGDDVDFIEDDGKITEVSLVGAYMKNMQPVKSRKIAACLGFFLGALGMHRIYLGYYVLGMMQITVTYFNIGYGIMWGLIEGALIISGHMYKDAKGRLLK